MLRHDSGHIIIDPICASESYRDEVRDCFIAVDVDDCDCGHCEVDRGPIPIYGTVSLGIVSGNVRVSQRLTITELRELADTLYRFADVLDEVSEATKQTEEDLA